VLPGAALLVQGPMTLTQPPEHMGRQAELCVHQLHDAPVSYLLQEASSMIREQL
jgi:hypothetical protein